MMVSNRNLLFQGSIFRGYLEPGTPGKNTLGSLENNKWHQSPKGFTYQLPLDFRFRKSKILYLRNQLMFIFRSHLFLGLMNHNPNTWASCIHLDLQKPMATPILWPWQSVFVLCPGASLESQTRFPGGVHGGNIVVVNPDPIHYHSDFVGFLRACLRGRG